MWQVKLQVLSLRAELKSQDAACLVWDEVSWLLFPGRWHCSLRSPFHLLCQRSCCQRCWNQSIVTLAEEFTRYIELCRKSSKIKYELCKYTEYSCGDLGQSGCGLLLCQTLFFRFFRFNLGDFIPAFLWWIHECGVNAVTEDGETSRGRPWLRRASEPQNTFMNFPPLTFGEKLSGTRHQEGPGTERNPPC